MKILTFLLKLEMVGLLIGEGMIQCMRESTGLMHGQNDC